MTKDQFIELVKSEQNALRGFLLALCCGNRNEADEIAQESLIKAYLSISSYSDRGRFRSWVFKIAHNTFLNHKSAARTYDSLEEAKLLAGASSADVSYVHEELYLALGTLPPKERSAITLHYLTGYSIKEIAAISDSTEDAVKKQLSRGRDKLRNILQK